MPATMTTAYEEVPLLPVRDVVIFPFMILPLYVGRERSIKAVHQALEGNRLLFLATQEDKEEEEPDVENIYQVGTLAMIMRMVRLGDDRLKVLVQGVSRARLVTVEDSQEHYQVQVERLAEPDIGELSSEQKGLRETVRQQWQRLAEMGRGHASEVQSVVENVEAPGHLADLLGSTLNLQVPQLQELLETLDSMERLGRVKELLQQELVQAEVQQNIQDQAREEMGKSQREYFLREQQRVIQAELGEGDPRQEDIAELRQKLDEAQLPEEARTEADKQLRRMEHMHPEAAEYTVALTYLETLAELPWQKSSRDRLDLRRARRVLDQDHYNLEPVKERILDYLAVRKLNKKLQGPVLCLVGPPGVGKTSLGRSVARCLGREFVRISLGGVRDEAEIRGHRRTYVGSMPGRIIQGIQRAGTNNPVFMLDELDKVGADFRGDPSSALLELLDPEQNYAFSDHYLGVPFDLSRVLFMATANMLDPVPPALRDRLEVIDLSGYTPEEKIYIGERFLVPRQLKANGLKQKQVTITRNALQEVIRFYTREAGLRQFEREVGRLCRKLARRYAQGYKQATRVDKSRVQRLLGAPKYLPEEERGQPAVGVVNGLAWTAAGGEMLQVEVTLMPGKGELNLTGQLGDVMQESARLAMSYARSHGSRWGADSKAARKEDVHIHVPAGATPKDGPSAGVTLVCALISVLSRRPVASHIAMSGEVTLQGRVLAVGGIKEKVLAARRAGISRVLLPAANRKDWDEIPAHLRRHIEVGWVDNVDEVLQEVLLDPLPADDTAPDASHEASA